MGSFCHGYQHDIHHANAPHQQGNSGDGGDQQRHGIRRLTDGLRHLIIGLGEKVTLAMRLLQ
ncbi:hypothetical protein D3C76_1256120 [compost metagenome]